MFYLVSTFSISFFSRFLSSFSYSTLAINFEEARICSKALLGNDPINNEFSINKRKTQKQLFKNIQETYHVKNDFLIIALVLSITF